MKFPVLKRSCVLFSDGLHAAAQKKGSLGMEGGMNASNGRRVWGSWRAGDSIIRDFNLDICPVISC